MVHHCHVFLLHLESGEGSRIAHHPQTPAPPPPPQYMEIAESACEAVNMTLEGGPVLLLLASSSGEVYIPDPRSLTAQTAKGHTRSLTARLSDVRATVSRHHSESSRTPRSAGWVDISKVCPRSTFASAEGCVPSASSCSVFIPQ